VPNGFISGRDRDDLESFFWRAVVAITPLAPPASTTYVYGWQALREFVMREDLSWNGHERNYVYLNASGSEGVRFFDVSELSGADFEDDTRVAATLDWDGDGQVDLLLASRTGPRLRLLRNTVPDPGHFLRLQLVGAGLRTDAVGARVELELETGSESVRRLSQTVYAGDGYLGCSSTQLHFGLGAHEEIARLTIRWPDGTEEHHTGVAVDTHLRAVQAQGQEPSRIEPADAYTPPDLTHSPQYRPKDPPGLIRLAEPLPLHPLSLPTSEGGLPVDSLTGQVTVFFVDRFSSGDATVDAFAKLVGDARRELPEDVGFVPVTFADAPGLSQQLAGRGLGATLVAGRAAQSMFRMITLEVLGPFDDLPMPVAFVVGKQGNLRSLHCATTTAELFDDLRAAAALSGDPEQDDGEDYLRGFWLRRPRRDLARMAQILRQGGQGAMADAYDRLVEQRTR
jgi:hypothetical protein